MANRYANIKRVRYWNGQRFIDDFHSVATIVALLPAGGFFQVLKRDVWDQACHSVLSYRMTAVLYANGRLVMAITDYKTIS